jgi:hypothetical protein
VGCSRSVYFGEDCPCWKLNHSPQSSSPWSFNYNDNTVSAPGTYISRNLKLWAKCSISTANALHIIRLSLGLSSTMFQKINLFPSSCVREEGRKWTLSKRIIMFIDP